MRHIVPAKFPILTLRQAIDRIGSLYHGDENQALLIAEVAKRLGFKEISVPARGVIQALIAYGLAEEADDGRLRMTTLARHLLSSTSEFERDRALVDAADRPRLFHKLNKRFRDREADDAELVRWLHDHHLADEAAEDALRVYRRTEDFVRQSRRRLADVLAAVANWAEYRLIDRQRGATNEERPAPDQDELEPTDLAWE